MPSSQTRVLAFVPDLMFGSKVKAIVESADLDCDLVSGIETLDLAAYRAVVIDLTNDVDARLAALEAKKEELAGTKTLAFYSHVENDVRVKALSGGIDMVVPRSRMAREGASLLGSLIED